MNRNEHIQQAETLLREAAQDGAMANTQVERQRVRDSILTAQVHATLAVALNGGSTWTLPERYQ